MQCRLRWGLLGIGIFVSVWPCRAIAAAEWSLDRFEYREMIMGVEARITLYAEDEREARGAARAAFDRMNRLDAVMSDYRDDSELMRVCGQGGTGPVSVSDDLLRVMCRAEEIGRKSDGTFDVTVGLLTRLWRQAIQGGEVPSDEEIREAQGLVGWDLLSLDADAGTLRFARSGMRLDLGGIGKGFAADEAVALLRERGVPRCLVDLGGDLAVGEAPPERRDEGWRIEIDPGWGDGEHLTIDVAEAGVATSGDAHQFVERNGVRYSHIVDPRTGYGRTDGMAVTVLASDAATADALASAISVLGREDGLALLEQFPGAEALIEVGETDETTRIWSDGFPAAAGGYSALFNSRDLSGWKGLVGDPVKRRAMSGRELAAAQQAADEDLRAHWCVEDGVLISDGKGHSLVTQRDYGDFELLLDWKIEPGGDSGIYLRGSPQVQIWDNPVGSGGLYNNQAHPSRPLLVADNPPGEWNTFRIVMIGERVSVWLNDIMVVEDTPLENYWERDRPIYARGPVELQAHGSRLAFRNMFIREIEDAEAERDLLRDTRLDWWREARFGMFIHWGLYAIPAGAWKDKQYGGPGEWLIYRAHIPPAEYAPLQARFNPMGFDAEAWVRLAKRAGMRYIIITSKHHEGFCLFDSAHTDYDVMDAPFGRDILRELADACARHGIRLGFYHSILDWHHPDYLPRPAWDPRPAAEADFERYVAHLRAQVRELLTNYGDVAVMWFDGEWEDHWTHEHGRGLYTLARRLRPDVIVNNRVDKGRQGMGGMTEEGEFFGDFGTPEQAVPGRGLPGVDWETCMTMNDSWGYKAHDHNWKSSADLIRTLVDIASKGGNFLLNVGPTALGEIPEPSIERLHAMGAWLEVNGESIHGTRASPFRRLPWGRCTQKPADGGRTLLYLHVFDWPQDNALEVPGLKSRPLTAAMLAGDGPVALRCRADHDGVIIQLPEEAAHPAASVVRLVIEGQPEVEPYVIRETAEGVIRLEAADAVVEGTTARYESGGGKDNIGYWTDAKDVVAWSFRLDESGRFGLAVAYACAPGNGGAFRVVVGEHELVGQAESTGSWTDFVRIELGEIALGPAGACQLRVVPVRFTGGALMNLRSVELRRVEGEG